MPQASSIATSSRPTSWSATKGSVKVLDFGLAKLTEPVDFQRDRRARHAPRRRLPKTTPDTSEGTVLGTAPYMSPEQAEGKPADARSDVFSFGAVLYEMITGRRAFSGDDEDVHTGRDPGEGAGAAERRCPGLHRDLEKMIAAACGRIPSARWQSMADLKVALEDLREESDSRSLAAGRPSRPADGPEPWRWRSRSIAWERCSFGAWWRSHSDQPLVGSRPLADAAHVRRRLDGLSGNLARWEDPRIRLRPQRRREPRYLGPADSRRARLSG